jgi:hypothetical protein
LEQKRKIDKEKMKLNALLVWGQDVEEDDGKGVAGVDYPVNPELLADWG